MRRTTTALLALLTVTATLVAAPGAALAQSDGNATVNENATATPSPDENATDHPEDENATDQPDEDENASVSPGERLSAVIGVQEAELEGELGTRAFGLAIARAASDERLAEVVGEEYNETNASVHALERRREALNESLANGSIGRGEYESRLTVLAAQAQVAQRQANMTANASVGLPADLLAEQGINVTAIQRLQTSAANLTGPQVARIAQSIAGAGVGASIADDNRPDFAGSGDASAGADNRTDGENPSDSGNRSDGGNRTADGSNQSDGSGAEAGDNQTDTDQEQAPSGGY